MNLNLIIVISQDRTEDFTRIMSCKIKLHKNDIFSSSQHLIKKHLQNIIVLC